MYPDKSDNSRQGISPFYRFVSFVGGVMLIGRGLKRGSLVQAAAGGYLAYKGVAGNRSFDEVSQAWEKIASGRNINIRTSLVVNRPRQEVYNAWRKLSNIPLFMKHINKVEEQGLGESRWEFKLPAGLGTLQWKAEVVKEVPGELLAWKSEEGSEIQNAGKVEFRDALGKQGTAIDVVFSYNAPLGMPGEKIARLFTPVFRKMILTDIRGFKDFIETRDEYEPGDMDIQPVVSAIP